MNHLKGLVNTGVTVLNQFY